MSKGLEALNKLVSHIETEYHSDDYYECKNAKDTIEKELKALEILLKKLSPSIRQSGDYFSACVLGSWSNNFELTQEEYDLLKEVLL